MDTFLCVVHPIEHDFRGPAVASGDIARHEICLRPSKSEIQQPDLIVRTHSNVARFNILSTQKVDDSQCTLLDLCKCPDCHRLPQTVLEYPCTSI